MTPEFSLIIPTFNRISALRRCFKHLQALRYPRELFEVILVDDGSDDATRDLKAEDFPLPLTIIHQANSGTAAARNVGIKAARGLFCLFVDDDVMVHPDLLLEHHRLHLGQANLVVRGPVINFSEPPCPLDEDFPASQLKEDSKLQRAWRRWSGQDPHMWQHFSMNYLCTSNASLARCHLLAAGLFDTSFKRWEDAELAVRLKRLGLKRCFSLAAIVYHWKPQETWEKRLETARKDGRSAAELYLRYPSLKMRLRSGIHPLNLLRNRLLTQFGPIRNLIEHSAQTADGPIPQGVAQNVLLEEAYLEAGLEALSHL